jgi:acyl carrier protein
VMTALGAIVLWRTYFSCNSCRSGGYTADRVLGLEDGIKPSATLQGDLGAESIDFLDIVFRLEREFGIKIWQGELFRDPVFQVTEVVQIGRGGLLKYNDPPASTIRPRPGRDRVGFG